MEMERVVGMTGVKNELASLVDNVDAYTKGGAKVPHFFIYIESGNGQTLATEVITDLLARYKMREFHGLDEFLEYKVDGTLRNLKWIFADIDDNSVYDNGYKGVVAIDISKLVKNLNGYEMKYFEEHLAIVAETATIILFCTKNAGIKGDKLRDKLCELIGNVKIVDEYIYSSNDFAQMITQNILDRGIQIRNLDKAVNVFSKISEAKNVSSAKEAIALAEKIVFYADYSGGIPTIDFVEDKDFVKNYCKEM